MTLPDIIILSILFVIVAVIVYFGIWKKRKNPCKGCSYAKNCESMNKCLEEYRKSREIKY